MTIALTPEMKRIFSKIKPYLVCENGEIVFKKNTPEKIIEYKKSLLNFGKKKSARRLSLTSLAGVVKCHLKTTATR